MPAIFISYRRDDAPGQAARIASFLAETFGSGAVFFDRTTIRPGQRFPAAIQRAIESCSVVLAVIGRRWNAPLLQRPDDWVRRELATALQHGKVVIPVLVDDAAMPARSELPPDLAAVSERECERLSDDHWHLIMPELARSIAEQYAIPAVQPKSGGAASVETVTRYVEMGTVSLSCLFLVLLFVWAGFAFISDRSLEITKFVALTAAVVLMIFAVTHIAGRRLQR